MNVSLLVRRKPGPLELLCCLCCAVTPTHTTDTRASIHLFVVQSRVCTKVCFYTHIHSHTHIHSQTNNTSAISRGELRTQWRAILCRAEHIQSAPGSSSLLPIVVASHFNIAQRRAANALLTHQRAAANPHSCLGPHSYVTAVPR